MSKIIFKNDQETIYDCDFSQIGENQIRLKFESNIPEQDIYLSGCCLVNEWNHSVIQTNRTDYTYLYRTYDEDPTVIELCNNNIPYVPIPVPEPYVPTPEELEKQFIQNKNNKIVLSKSMLADFLENNPIHSTVHNGIAGIYSVTSDKQTLMLSQYMTYQIEKAMNPDVKLTWNETGKSCEEWDESEFLQLILEIKSYVYPLVSYQQRVEEDIYMCKTQEELDKIIIDYNSLTPIQK